MTTTGAPRPVRFLENARPALPVEEGVRLARELFGIEAEAEEVYAERDQNFRLSIGGEPRYMLKIGNAEDDGTSIDLQIGAILHVRAQDPDLAVPDVVRSVHGRAYESITRANGDTHTVHVLTFVPGISIGDAPHSTAQYQEAGVLIARVAKALRGFFHPAGGREMLWDIRTAPRLAPFAESIADPASRKTAVELLRRFETDVAPKLLGLRSQIIHADANPSNVLVDAANPDRAAGMIDFGDTIHGPLVLDLGVAMGDLDATAAERLEYGCAMVAGYHSVLPLADDEVDLLYDLAAGRIAVSAAIAARRRAVQPAASADLVEAERASLRHLDEWLALDRGAATLALRSARAAAPAVEARRSPPPVATAPIEALLERRRAVVGRRLSLFYEQPLHLVRGEGAWLFDAEGRRYVDAYNNVPNIGHAHPHVVEAIARQAALLNTNTRYVFTQLMDFAERLTSKLPSHLEVCAFVNSGSEAVDLAWRMATKVTGRRGGIVMENAYHGWTEAVFALSPAEGGPLAPHVRTLMAPDDFRGPYRRGEPDLGERYAADADRAIGSLRQAGLEPAAFVVDTGLCSNGMLDGPPGYVRGVFDRVHAAGGLCIADEVQAGFGRPGTHMWGFEAHGASPDIVTMGKPIGNGHPIGVVVTTREILAKFTEDEGFFSTFGGNTVACAAGMAVLDVLEREQLQENARAVGEHMRFGMRALMDRHPLLGDVRGRGFLNGAELVKSRETLEPATAETKRVMNLMREYGVLVGREGPDDNVLKIRPPLALNREQADMVVAALDRALSEVEASGGA